MERFLEYGVYEEDEDEEDEGAVYGYLDLHSY